MKIFGQLKEAILERVVGDKSGSVEGQIWYDSISKRIRFKDDSADRHVVDENSTQNVSNKSISSSTVASSTISTSSVTLPTRLDVKSDDIDTLEVYASGATSGQLVYADDEEKYYGIVNGQLVELGSGGTIITETQVAHGFSALDPIYHNGTQWVLAQADDEDTLAEFVVIEGDETGNVDRFIAAKFGKFELTGHGLTVGEHYFLAHDSLGGYNFAYPEEYSCPLFYVQDANNIIVEVYRPSAPAEPVVLEGFADEIGSIIMQSASAAVPAGSIYCDGSLYNIADYQELYAKVGTTYGGDGVTTFRVPDFEGQFLRGWDGTRTMGVAQADATAQNGLSLGTHTHSNTHNHTATASGGSHSHSTTGSANGVTLNAGSSADTYQMPWKSSAGDNYVTPTSSSHSHTISVTGHSGSTGNNTSISITGDSETRPANYPVKFYIRAFKTQVTVSVPALQTDIVVGTADDLARNLAQYTSLQAAHDAAADGDIIKVLGGNIAGNTTITKRISIRGSGHKTVLTGTLDLNTPSDGCLIKELRFGDDLTIANGADNHIITDCWADNTAVIVDNNPFGVNIITVLKSL